jgi:lysophospholipase L1-like esterase
MFQSSAYSLCLVCVCVISTVRANEVKDTVERSHRILFLGDSITAAGQYVAYFDAYLTARRNAVAPIIINCGLPSETVSGLSEEGHAGGAFPRPDLAERLDRVLKLAKPDLVIACYGINCGIYEPFAEERLAKYQQGMQRLKEKAEEAGAKLILVTPPFYDDRRAPKPFSYNEVLNRYSQWLLDQRSKGWLVVDLHGPMTKEVHARREKEKNFTFQPDGVHPNDAGHWYIAQQLILALGDERASKWSTPEEMTKELGASPELIALARQRVDLLRDAYVAAAGHKRPGVAKGLPLEDAERKAAELTAKIHSLQ